MNYFCCDKELPVFQGWTRKRHGSAKPASAKWKAWPAHYVWHKCGTQWQVAIKMLVTATSGEGVGVCAHGGRNPSAGVRAAHAGRRGAERVLRGLDVHADDYLSLRPSRQPGRLHASGPDTARQRGLPRAFAGRACGLHRGVGHDGAVAP